MAATFAWGEDTGNQAGSPTKGTTRFTPTDVNWKNSSASGDLYSSFPITAGNNSFDKWQFGILSGTFNQVTAGLFGHTAGVLGAGLTLLSQPSMTADGSNLSYTTPTTVDHAAVLTNDMTTTAVIASGRAVWFGSTGPEAAGKAATQDGSATRYTNWLTTQLKTTTAATAGDTATVTLTLEYQEN